MTYQKLFYLKFKKGIPTYELLKRYPDSTAQVNEVALLEIPEETLRQLLQEPRHFNRLMRLKKKYLD